MEYCSNSPEETAEFAKKFAERLKPGDVITLDGDLGVGKTAFVQGLAKALGVSEYVSSPTFTIVNCYDGRLPLYHFDVYRIDDCDEMYEVGYDEYVGGDGVAVIEWADKIADILPVPRYAVTIAKDDTEHDNFRRIKIELIETGDLS